MMGIEVPKTCWAYHKGNEKHQVASCWFFISLTITMMHGPIYIKHTVRFFPYLQFSKYGHISHCQQCAFWAFQNQNFVAV
jgi:hypothetical membrane protein